MARLLSSYKLFALTLLEKWYRTGGNRTRTPLIMKHIRFLHCFKDWQLQVSGVTSLKRVKTLQCEDVTRVQMNIVMLFSYNIYINNIIFIGLQRNLQNFRFHVKGSVFVSSTFDMQNQDRNLFNE